MPPFIRSLIGTRGMVSRGWKTGRRTIWRKYISLDPLCDVNWRMESRNRRENIIVGKRNFVFPSCEWNLFPKFTLFYFLNSRWIKPEKREKYGKFDQKKERRNEKIGVVNLFIYKLVDKSIERTFTCIKVNLNIVTP